ncbi:MAG: hypothetical protein GY853_05085 [PVC group bacterium]|nr:hypothetical protein [PVC group bacterium]
MTEIFIISACGFIFIRRNVLNGEVLRGMGSLTINLFFPCLIFSHFIRNFTFETLEHWWIYPILGLLISGLGAGISLIFLSFHKERPSKNEFISLIAFQNCGYLPLILVRAIFPQVLADNLLIAIFLFIQGFNFVFWSFGVRFLSENKNTPLKIKHFMNAPMTALLISVVIILAGIREMIPEAILKSSALVGECTFPMALLVLGGILAEGAREYKKMPSFYIEVIIGKLIILPLVVLFLISKLELPKVMAALIIIQAVMPPAINLSVVAYDQKADFKSVGQAVLIAHIAAIITIPVIMGAFLFFYN